MTTLLMDEATLTTAAATILQAIVEAPRAWATLEQIAALCGDTIPPDDIPAVLVDLTIAGLVEGWPAKEAWTLTPLSAERLGVTTGTSRLGHVVWVPADQPEPRPRPNLEAAEQHHHFIHAIPDHRERFDVNLAFPRILLTGSTTVWHEKPGRVAGKDTPKSARVWQCPTCRGAKLPRDTTCLRCLNSGRDDQIRRELRHEAIHEAMTAREKRRAEKRQGKHRRRAHLTAVMLSALANKHTLTEIGDMLGLSKYAVLRLKKSVETATQRKI